MLQKNVLTLKYSKVRTEVLKPVLERFLNKISVSNNNGCWEWTAYKTQDGYGQFRINGNTEYSHRFSYKQYKKNIPKGLHIDHLCRNRACVNPAHLEAVTCKENILRGIGFGAVNAKKTHCAWGHQYTPDNTYLENKNKRHCRKCGAIRASKIRKNKENKK